MTAIRKHIRNTIAGALLLSGTALAGDAASAAAAPVAATIPAHARLPRTNSGPTNWSTDAYQYDASGNIIAIGQQSFIYDTTNRLVSATTAMPVDGQADAMQTETFNYDVYGNMTDRTVDSLTTTSAIDATTNRLTAFSAQYDTAGNLTHMQPPGSARTYDYDYDSFNMLRDMRSPTSNPAQPYWVIYIYTADDQRLWTYNVSGNVSHWTIRDLGGNVLRDFKNDGNAPAASQWSLSRDYIYREGALLAAVNPRGSEHFTLDHLGTPRLITSATGVRIGQHTYRAFGNERSNLGVQEDDPRKFTGHERDHDPAGETVAELDYMHARYYNAALGRFLSLDPVQGRPEAPQSWNRYSYVLNNPINRTDPDGRCTIDGEKHGRLWCAAHALGLTQTEHERVTTARNFFEQNDVVVGGQHIDPSTLSDKQVMTAFASFNATWRNAGPAAPGALISAVTIPATALSTLQAIDSSGAAPPGYQGGRPFENDGRNNGETLPKSDGNGNPIKYREWDVKPSQPGVNRGGERIVTGSDGSAWYTNNHYQTFTKLR
jgi:RHS repeat-associated protein